LTAHRVVLTGAASGIGAATLRAFHEEAAAVEVITLDRVELPEDLAALSTQHVIVDLSDAGSIDRAVKEIAIDAEIDAVCNVAGVPGTADPATVLAVNFLGLRHLTESLVDRIRDGGSIVNVASIAGAQWMTNLSDVRRLIATVSFADGVDWVRDQPMDGARAYNFSKKLCWCGRWRTVCAGGIDRFGSTRYHLVRWRLRSSTTSVTRWDMTGSRPQFRLWAGPVVPKMWHRLSPFSPPERRPG
jgi:NAD(P)-dependent dehydrogenase (short-subunit alcohol dehydrogenase family)